VSGAFVAGTDTGVGKTLVACALLRRAAGEGRSAVGMKPVSAGGDEDAAALAAAGTVRADRALVNPYALREAIAPHIAAAREGVAVDLRRIRRCFDELKSQADVIVVEGVGGFRAPLSESQDAGDLAKMLALPVVLVVGLRLGCLNHALLTQEAIASRGLKLAGWVANRIDPGMERCDENVDFLRRALAAPLLGDVPFTAQGGAARIASAVSALATSWP
jgi:dethiobiotin synthetase